MVLKVAEISRVLRPGGVFVATTYILDGPLSYIPFLRNITQVHLSLTRNLHAYSSVILLNVPHLVDGFGL